MSSEPDSVASAERRDGRDIVGPDVDDGLRVKTESRPVQAPLSASGHQTTVRQIILPYDDLTWPLRGFPL